MSIEKQTLNDIIRKFQDLENLIMESDGEITDDLENILLQNDEDLSKKLDGYEKFSRYLKGQVEYLKTAEEQYSKRRKVLDNSINRIKERMLNAMLIVGKDKIKTTEYNFSVGNSEKWNLDIEKLNEKQRNELLLSGLAENVFKAKISEIKSEYKDSELPDWIIVEKNKHIRVK